MNKYCKRDFSTVCLVHRMDMSVLFDYGATDYGLGGGVFKDNVIVYV